jgi:hypothetical protein
MLREPRPAEPFHAPPDFLSAGLQAREVILPTGGRVDPVKLRRFARRMAVRGHAVQLARMGYDRLYAWEVLSLAQLCEDDALIELSVDLYRGFQRTA